MNSSDKLHITFATTMLITLAVTALPAAGQQQIPGKVDIPFNRVYDYQETTDWLQQLADAYPDLLTLQSLGKSEQGREMWLVIMNNDDTGPHTEKPAMWIDGNVHGNEVQASENVLYSIWYLVKSYGEVEQLTELADRAAFYFVPMANPDGRDFWLHEPNTPHSSRTGHRPTDNDYDGLLDEDGPEDIDGDGHIGRMYRFDPNGRFRRNRDDPRIIERVRGDQQGELEFAGWEGIDNDGDGRINEDGSGGYDMNRNWPSGWLPTYVQRGAGEFPLDRPETKVIADFILEHPNIAAGQSYHNAGGMILRGPGASFRENLYPRDDQRVYDQLGRAGEEMLPFYRYMIIHADLYTVHGGFVTWLSEGLGIISFTNELWTDNRILQNGERPDSEERMRWNDRMLFGQTFTDWTEHDHPTLGKVLIGGGTKYSSRNPPPFMIEEEAHRNFAFTMFHAEHMPELSFDYIQTRRIAGNVWEVTIEVGNERIIPSRTAIAAQKDIGQPDRLVLSNNNDVNVIAAGVLDNRFDTTIDPVKHRKQIIPNDAGIPGRGERAFRYLVVADPGTEVTLRYEAEKARTIETTVTLQENDE